MVASMLHEHPENPPKRPTLMYNLPTAIHPVRGEGTVNVGWPSRIHWSKLRQLPSGPSCPVIMKRSDLEALIADISGFHLGGLQIFS